MSGSRRFSTLEDLQFIVDNRLSEDLRLEYKSSSVIADSDTIAVSKAASAFANSVGGQFIVGIRGNSKAQTLVLDGGLAGRSKLDWLHQIVSANTHPPVEGVEIIELNTNTGAYYILTIPASSQAPHQAEDHRYYKRNGTHSLPMEHYEVEDVRNRPKAELRPLDIVLAKDNFEAFLRLKNISTSDDASEITCEVSSNVKLDARSLERLQSGGIRRLPPGEELYFLMGSIGMLLSEDPDAELSIVVKYKCRDVWRTERQTFYLAHYGTSMIVRDPIEQTLMNIEEQLKSVVKQLQKMNGHADAVSQIADATGLRLSQRTLLALKGEAARFDPREFDSQGYRIVLGISKREASQLSDIFHTLIHFQTAKKEYEALTPKLREKFEAHFDPVFYAD